LNKVGLLLDFYGTLVEDDRKMVELFIYEWIHYYGAIGDKEEIHEFWTRLYIELRLKYQGDDYKTRNRIQNMVLERLFKRFKINASYDEYAARLYEQRTNANLYPDTNDFLKFLKEENIPHIILTDGDDVEVNSVLKLRNIEIEDVITSQQVRYYKPSIKIYSQAVKLMEEKYGINKENIINIGDSHWSDVIGAKNYGINCIWINRLERNLPIPENFYNVKNLSQAKRIIKGLLKNGDK